MKMIDAILMEMDQESKTTRKFLEAFPADKMNYKPHEKSMTAAQLANHVATIPGHLAEWAVQDTFNMVGGDKSAQNEPKTKDEILQNFEKSLEQAKKLLSGLDDGKMMANWTFQIDGKTAMSMPRMVMVRSFIMNHLYHHRGQFGVYLRLMGAKVPSSYGPSADDNPMADLMQAAGKN